MAGTDDLKNMLMAFKVSELQTLLSYAGRCKNGRKTELQNRAIELLKLKSTPIQMKIRELYKDLQQHESAVQHHRNVGYSTQAQGSQWNQAKAYPGAWNQYGSGSVGGKPYPVPPQFAAPAMSNGLPVHPDVKLRPLPFYDQLSELLKPTTLMPVGAGRIQEQSFMFHLTPAQANEVSFNRDENVQVQMRFCLLETSCEQEDCFPPGIIVKVNGKACALPTPIPSTKQGVESKRPPGPVNITTHVRKSPTVANMILVSWSAEFGCGFVIAINMVRKLTSAQLVQRLKARGARNKDYTTGLIKEKLSEDGDSEIATMSLRVSLMCPLGKMRMSLPCRPTTCSHLQCFDATLYMQMNERKPSWSCPVCNLPGFYDKLVIDGYFQEVLGSSKLPPGASEIELHRDGSWSVSGQEGKDRMDTASPPLVKNRGSRPLVAATVEIIDDDDVIPVYDSEETIPEKIQPPAVQPNVSTVDLTLSDDDDDVLIPILATASTADGPPGVGGISDGGKPPFLYNISFDDIIALDSPSPPASPDPDPEVADPLAVDAEVTDPLRPGKETVSLAPV